ERKEAAQRGASEPSAPQPSRSAPTLHSDLPSPSPSPSLGQRPQMAFDVAQANWPVAPGGIVDADVAGLAIAGQGAVAVAIEVDGAIMGAVPHAQGVVEEDETTARQRDFGIGPARRPDRQGPDLLAVVIAPDQVDSAV